MLILGVGVATLVNGGAFACIASSSRSWGFRPGILILLLPGVGLALLLGLGAVNLAKARAGRMSWLALLVSGLLSFAPFTQAIDAGYTVRMSGFHEFVERSRPLVSAIRAYAARHGTPPTALDDLVPEFLSAVPETGIGPSPAYQYVHGEEAQRRFDERWVLFVPCSSGFLNFDRLLYYESGEYPAAFGTSAWLEPIGDWAYEHE